MRAAVSLVVVAACWTGYVEPVAPITNTVPAPTRRATVKRACLADQAERVPTRPDMWTQCGSSWSWTPPDYWHCVAGELEQHVDELRAWVTSALLWCGP